MKTFQNQIEWSIPSLNYKSWKHLPDIQSSKSTKLCLISNNFEKKQYLEFINFRKENNIFTKNYDTWWFKKLLIRVYSNLNNLNDICNVTIQTGQL